MTSYTLEYQVDQSLLQRATTSWIKPHKRLPRKLLSYVGYILAGSAIGATFAFLGLLDRVTPDFMTGMLLGFYAGLLLWYIVNKRHVKRLAGFAATALHKQGPTRMTLSQEGIVLDTKLSRSEIDWQSIDQIIEMADATALRIGAMIHPIPDSALPEGTTALQFRADLAAWATARA